MQQPKVLYEDNHLIVALKPFGMPSQEDESKDLDMLSWVKAYVKQKYQKPGKVFIGLVHRLDRVAGGLMVFARTSKAAGRLSEAIRNQQFDKGYQIVVEGRMKDTEGKLEDLLYKDREKNKVKIASKEDAKSRYALLYYKTTAIRDDFSLVEVDLKTGRSHQIRVQFSGRGCPVVGDLKYGSKHPDRSAIALWSWKLSFLHPTTKEAMTFLAEAEEYLCDRFPWKLFADS